MSFPELVIAGALCKVKTWFTTPSLQLKAMPDEEDMAEKLWKVYNTEYNHREIQDMAHYFWNWDSKIIQEWMMVLDMIQGKLDRSCLKIPKQSKRAKELSQQICEY
jgi:hypothetical protein